MPSSPEEPDSPISLSRFNIKPIPPGVWNTYFGKIRAFNTFTALEWIYLATSLVALTVSLAIAIQRLTVEKPNESDFTFAILLIVTILFCYHYVVHSIFTESWDELMVFVVSTLIVLVYTVTNYINHPDGSDQPIIKLVRLIIVGVLSPFLIIVGILQSYRYCASNNLLYNTVGGISRLQDACRMFHICVSLLKFDLHLQISMLILVMGQGITGMSLTQKVILGSGLPFTFIFIIFGYLGLRFESISLIVFFYIFGLLEPVYIVYKFYYTATYEKDNEATYDATFACGYFALVIWVLLVFSTLYFTKYYFGKGLKEKMFGQSDTSPSSTIVAVNNAITSEVENANTH